MNAAQGCNAIDNQRRQLVSAKSLYRRPNSICQHATSALNVRFVTSLESAPVFILPAMHCFIVDFIVTNTHDSGTYCAC